MTQARFISIPAYLPIPLGKGEWVSTGKLLYYSKKLDLLIEVPKGSVNNLASIPRMFRSLFAVNGPHRLAAALHDYLYEGKTNLSRGQCDDVFYEAMRTTQCMYLQGLHIDQRILLTSDHFRKCADDNPLVSRWKAKILYKAVRVGGSSSFNKG